MTTLIITTKDHLTDANQTKSLKVNPNADSAKLKTFAQMMVAMSKDNYVKTVRIDEADLDNPKPQIPITRMDVVTAQSTYPTFTVDNPVVNLKISDINATTKILQTRIAMPYTFAAPVLTFDSENWTMGYARYGMHANSGTANNTWTLGAACTAESIQPQSFVMHIHFDETAQYAAFDLDVTVNITEEG